MGSTSLTGATISGIEAGTAVITAEAVRMVDGVPTSLDPVVSDTFEVTVTGGT